MIDFRNPYTPGAGVMPKYLAGRDAELQSAKQKLLAIKAGYPARSVVYYGLRGVGKTVILNAVTEQAEDHDILARHIEVKEESGSFIQSLSYACSAFVLNLSAKKSLQDKLGKLMSVIRSFTATWNPSDNTISFEMTGDAFSSATAGTGNLTNDLTEVLVELGRYAKKAETAICFCIDEIQYASQEELEALITAVHRINQLGLPVIFFCAGLPKILKTMGDVKSYTERLFEFSRVDSLEIDAARSAIIEPAAKLNVSFDDDAVDAIIELTGGYPYFIQETCATIWENCFAKTITANDVASNIEATNARLDNGFFLVRFNRCTPREQDFLVAMVQCGELPCTMANIAANMGVVPTRRISPFRAKLISKGVIYATSYGEVDFTVPKFDDFIRRTLPNRF